LLGTRRKVPAPAPGEQFRSVIKADSSKHGAKPIEVRKMTETMFPNLPKIELFARKRCIGWDAWIMG
jgi:N6-adenosine-specific RNA methylase IME4